MAVEQNEVYEKVSTIVANQLNISKDSITLDSTLENLGADSLDRVEIVMRLEEEFGVEISDEDADTMDNLNNVVSYLKNALSIQNEES